MKRIVCLLVCLIVVVTAMQIICFADTPEAITAEPETTPSFIDILPEEAQDTALRVYDYIIAILPAISAIVAMIVALLKMIAKFKELREDVHEENKSTKKKLDTTNEQLKMVINENAELKKEIKALTLSINRVNM